MVPTANAKPISIPTLTEVKAERSRRSLVSFVKNGWHVVEPGTPLVWNWHIDAICEHLEAVTRGELQNLLINIPPGHMKSLLVSVFWPVWEWLQQPDSRWLFASYALELALRDSVRCRDLIQSDWYQSWFAPEWHLRGDENRKTVFQNSRAGFRFCMSVSGRATGFRGNKIVTDDPLNAKEMYSEAVREECLFWWDKAMSTRLNDPRSDSKVIIMQRLHERDLSGHVLAQGGYEHLCLPSEFEAERRSRTFAMSPSGGKRMFWKDPRTEDGELLFPELFTQAVLDDLKHVTLGPLDYAGQHQQRPAPREGAMFLRQWFQPVTAAPTGLMLVRYWDKAGAKPGKGDWTVGVLMGRDAKGGLWILDVVRGQWPADERNTIILQTAHFDRQAYGTVRTFVEQEPGLGKESTEAIVTLLAGFSVFADPARGKKEERAEPFSAQCRAGNVHMIVAPWNEPYLAVMTVFPNGAHDDDPDATSGAFNRLCEMIPVSTPAVAGARPLIDGAAHGRMMPGMGAPRSGRPRY